MSGNKNSGRRPYKPSSEERQKVRVLKNGGMSNEAIASVIGITEVTLAKHFYSDLAVGAAQVRAEILLARYESAIKGNVSAQNRLLDRDEMVAPARAAVKQEPMEKAPKMGKKEIAQVQAETAHVGSDWGTLLQ